MYGLSGMMANENIAKAYAACMTSVIEANKQRAEMLKELAAKQEAAQKAQQAEALDQLEKQEEVEEQQLLEATTKKETVTKYEDSEDGGKTLTWWGKLKNFGKGAVNTVKGMFCDENGFSLKRTLTTVAVGAGCIALTVATGGAAAPFLVGAGVAMGAVHAGKGIYKVATAENAAEEAAGWQDIGGGTFEIAASAAGAKGALKMAGKPVPTGGLIKGTFRAGKECFLETAKGTYKVARHPFKSGKAVKNYFAEGGEGRANLNKAFGSKNAKENVTSKMNNQYERQIAKLEAKKKNLIEENAKLDATKDAKKIAKNREEISKLNEEITTQQKYKSEISENVAPEVDNARIKKLTEEIDVLIKEKNKIDPVKNNKEWNQVQAKIEKKIDARAHELTKETVVGARNNQINGYKEKIKTLKEDLKTAKEEKPTTDAGKKLRKEKIENIKKEIERNEQQIKEAEKFSKLEEQQRTVESAEKKIEINKKTAEKHQAEIDRLTKENEALAKSHTAADDAKILENQKVINEHQTIIDRTNTGIAKQEAIIAKAKTGLHYENVKAAAHNLSNNTKLTAAAATAGTEGVLFGNTVTPGTQEVTLKADNQEELLTQLKEAQEARRKQVAASFNKQSQINPFQLAQAIMPQSSGIDSLALYQSPFPNIM